MKVRGDFLGPPRSTDKTTLIIKVSNGAKTCQIVSLTTCNKSGFKYKSIGIIFLHFSSFFEVICISDHLVTILYISDILIAPEIVQDE